jgi:pyrroline-5-carboxylate reductase
MNIRFIGYGRLAKSLIKKWQIEHQITVSAPRLTESDSTQSIKTTSNNQIFLDKADIVVLAVKPKVIPLVLHEIRNYLNPNSIVISLAAGITLNKLQKFCPNHEKIIRAMPNIAAEIGQSATLILSPIPLRQTIEPLFTQLGTVHWVEQDDLLDIGTILAGSGPAYVFYFMRTLQETGITLGMPEDLCRSIIQQTFLGATLLSLNKSDSLLELQHQVTSPQGTTAAALALLDEKHVDKSLEQAIQSAWKRILELRLEI